MSAKSDKNPIKRIEKKQPIKEEQNITEAEEITDDPKKQSHSESKVVAERFMGMVFSQMKSGFSEVASKLNEGHIDKLIEASSKDAERNFKDRKNQRLFIVVIIILGVALLIFLTVFLAIKHETTLMNILIPILAFLGGMGAGYGIAKKS